MNFTFGISTVNNERDRLNRIITSIHNLNIPEDKYEIIVIGGEPIEGKNVVYRQFDEWRKPGWLTRKKNLIAEMAKFDNISIGHDYVIYDKDWYNGFLELGEDWDVAMCKIINTDGKRFRDWVSWYNDGSTLPDANTIQFLSYDDHTQTHLMYISGTYYCIKKRFALRFTLDENKSWGESEDCDFSLRARNLWNYKMNKNSTVRFIKDKPHWPIPE